MSAQRAPVRGSRLRIHVLHQISKVLRRLRVRKCRHRCDVHVPNRSRRSTLEKGPRDEQQQYFCLAICQQVARQKLHGARTLRGQLPRMVPNHLTVGNHTSPQSVGDTAHHLPLATLAGGAPQGRALLSSDNPATGGVSGTLSSTVRVGAQPSYRYWTHRATSGRSIRTSFILINLDVGT